MDFKQENGQLIIVVVGNVDTSNAEQWGAEVNAIRAEHPEGRLVLDCEELRYISSAGLRQILRLKKLEKDLLIINVSSDVYEVFDMTGFAEMIEIQKGYRKLSVDGCEVIGQGSNGVVYRINEDTIIKVYRNNDALEDIKRERELAKTALVLGVNTAIPYDVVKVGDKFGSVFELLSCKSISKLIVEDPDNLDNYVKILSDKLKEVHGTLVKPNILPDFKDAVTTWVDFLKDHLDGASYEKFKKMVDEIPYDLHMLHGDFHSNNVHYANGEAILIDMDTLATGYFLLEFGSIYNACIGFGELDSTKVSNFLKIPYDIANKIFFKLIDFYFDDKSKEEREDIINKSKVLGYARMLRRTIKRNPDETEFIKYCKERLVEALSKVDSLLVK